MKNRFRVTALLAMLLMLATHASLLHAKVEQRPVYICGYAVNFADSAAYVTEIQCIDTAYVESRNGFLMDRNLYSDQLNYFVKKQFGGKHYTCMVLFDKKQARLQKRVAKMRKRQENDPSVRLHTIAAADFRFIGEQYIDTSVTMIDEEEAATTEAAAPAPAARPRTSLPPRPRTSLPPRPRRARKLRKEASADGCPYCGTLSGGWPSADGQCRWRY